jgi:hypothetical protein
VVSAVVIGGCVRASLVRHVDESFFHTTARLAQHWKKDSSTCLTKEALTQPPMTTAETTEARTIQRQQQQQAGQRQQQIQQLALWAFLPISDRKHKQ